MTVETTQKNTEISKENSRYTFRLFRKFQIEINKPLILLKICLFLHYGGGFMPAFITILYKQHGVTLKEMSTMYIFAPIMQILFSYLSGMIADKIGRAKPVFIVVLVLSMGIIVSIWALPPLKPTACKNSKANISCGAQNLKSTFLNCYKLNISLEASTCHFFCPSVCSVVCPDMQNFSVKIPIEGTHFGKGHCFYAVGNLRNENYTVCEEGTLVDCHMSCEIHECHGGDEYSRNTLLVVYAFLYVFLLTTYTSTFRMMDVTVMTLVKEHSGHFGRERFFSILGDLTVSPIAGYLVYVTTPEGHPDNYSISIGLCLILKTASIISICFLKVPINPPGQNIGIESFKFIKNPDVIVFYFMLLVLGAATNFDRYTYWYLEDLGASSILIGLLSSVSGMYGLPFLLTSKFWIEKFGIQGIFFLSPIGYTVAFIAYSFIENTWIALIIVSLDVLTSYLFWVAVVQHSNNIAPEGITSVVISMAGAIHFSGGKSAVGLTGGQVMSAYGARVAYRFMASMCFIFGILYALYYYTRQKWIKKKVLMNE